MQKLLTVVIVVVAAVIGLTAAIIAAAPYIAMGIVAVGVIYLAVLLGEDEDPPSGPPAVR
jgi:fatty acid desaturase